MVQSMSDILVMSDSVLFSPISGGSNVLLSSILFIEYWTNCPPINLAILMPCPCPFKVNGHFLV